MGKNKNIISNEDMIKFIKEFNVFHIEHENDGVYKVMEGDKVIGVFGRDALEEFDKYMKDET